MLIRIFNSLLAGFTVRLSGSVVILVVCVFGSSFTFAQSQWPVGVQYRIDGFDLRAGEGLEVALDPTIMQSVEVNLVLLHGVYYSPSVFREGQGVAAVRLRLGQISQDNPIVIDRSAFGSITEAIRATVESRLTVREANQVVHVRPSAEDVDAQTGRDMRAGEAGVIRFVAELRERRVERIDRSAPPDAIPIPAPPRTVAGERRVWPEYSPPMWGVGEQYPVDSFGLTYVHDFTWLPDRTLVQLVEVDLVVLHGVHYAPAAFGDGGGGEQVRLRLGDVTPEQPIVVDSSALGPIGEAIHEAVAARLPIREPNLFIQPHPADIDLRTAQDIRPRETSRLRFRLEYTGRYRLVDRIMPRYVQIAPPQSAGDRPTIAELMGEVRVEFALTSEGLVAWRPGAPVVSLSLAEIAWGEPLKMSDAAIQQCVLAVRDYIVEWGLVGVVVRVPLPDHADPESPVEIVLPVVTGVVDEVRTLAQGQRLPGAVGPARVNHPSHRRWRDRSPLQRGFFLKKQELDDYVHFLGRHPGRRVDVALAPGEAEYSVALDYLITENRPLMLYTQVSNTGTKQTGEWRVRFGLMHTQLTGNDDILALDYSNAEFTRTHAFTGSYEARVWDFDRLRWRVHGLWSEFDASEVGLAFIGFKGEQWHIGGELIYNFFQDKQLFVDAIMGVRYMHAEVQPFFFGIPFGGGQEAFIIPHIGLRMERITDLAATRGLVQLEGSMGSWTSVDGSQLEGLGRPDPDADWLALQWDVSHSFFLEPLLDPQGWRDPETWATSTLAHEVMLGVKGQYAFNRRLIPQLTMVAGGMYTVRGYPQAVVAGDTVFLGTAEYRLHIPRLFQPGGTPGQAFGQPFRWRPQHVYGQPDWNLIFRTFIDAGYTIPSKKQAFETSHTLLGDGIGLELMLRRNVNLRLDWGFALQDLHDAFGTRLVRTGSNQVHFSATFLY